MAENSVEALDFTDGDTFKRFTIANADVTRQSVISAGVQRMNVAEDDDAGWHFAANVVSVAAGTFDVNVSASVLGEPPINDEGPTELVYLTYTLY